MTENTWQHYYQNTFRGDERLCVLGPEMLWVLMDSFTAYVFFMWTQFLISI